ncbi:uncharacterized protein LOC112083022 [Eutrema salsugineum]|uniref:uncharacterized protein LOC112083022 n=1 Tax=Eutrema salsugineum TaxID=72664 RepID=UPI000CECF081|nr:uncharacterized protein LOC112083022 [Eutrema salsugineum]
MDLVDLRSEEGLQLHAHLSTIAPPTSEAPDDFFEWSANGISSELYSSSRTWEVLRPRSDKKDWADLVWFKVSVLKHAFTMWVANLNRLPTRVRLASCGLQVPLTCCLCSTLEENCDHLLRTCDYSIIVWKLVLARLKPHHQMFQSWIRQSNASAPAVFRKLAAQAIVFQLWKQRNNILHNSEVRNTISAKKT